MNTIQKRIDDLLKVHRTYRALSAATGVEFTQLQKMHAGKMLGDSAATLAKLGLKKVVTYREL